ncbi:myo-inositol-1(or 4)-monophosphatase [Pseudoscardovia suis]|uniref:Inositol monophosphatase n=2 Tax=Pseudoscardovia suis TaxID=987063 RepID=A0A261F1V2_9BIFI|nr:inositol monophosphatase family protein [Pseudoscardovia suis]OZG52906.1 inositol monophosphatase [Pseudoscardovia suis]PJJ68411.1 myo-inositol-1(or 4)-monophosphatase [Pseudoscardovia suis]
MANIINPNPSLPSSQRSDSVDAERALNTSDTNLLRSLTFEISTVANHVGDQVMRSQLRPHGTQAKQDEPGAAFTTDLSDTIMSMLRAEVSAIDPLKGFWEDGGADLTPGNRYWSLCPLDGTINYLRNLSEWTITIAILEVNEFHQVYPVLGVVYAPALGLMYLAARGEGAIRIRHSPQGDEKREAVIPSAAKTLRGSVICFGMSYFPEESKLALNAAASMAGLPADIKRIGPASLDLCKVADGTYDAYFEPALHSWDVPAVAAATVVVWEAQGTLERWDGNQIAWDSDNDVLATNGVLRDEIREYLNKAAHASDAAAD